MKDEILKVLKENPGEYISGEELSIRLEVSRTAIWKYINQLKSLGYQIDSQTKKGYKLVEAPDRLTSIEIQPLLHTNCIGRKIIYFDEIDSTNSYAKRIAENQFDEGTVIIADQQTAGRGRLGRNWISPKGKGIWMSMLLKPQINPMDASKVTLAAACSVCNAVREVSGLDALIKWPNDIVVNGKKLCGILTEMGAELDAINYLVVGIGINANLDEKDFDEAVKGIATSIKIVSHKEISRRSLAAALINNFESYYSRFAVNGSIDFLLDEYKEKLAVLGRQVRIINKADELTGIAEDITRDGHLLVRTADGTYKEIVSGEVSVRGIYGYV